MARPPKPAREKRSKLVLIRLTPPEHRKLKAEARRRRTTVAGLMRDAALQQIEDGGEPKREER